ncbi:MAG: molybdate ABC transporter substrate-binding protein [Longimicrobiales bacterium]|nr:molybdate ABC transporter substrate-binding protein [Longimicrobiales bacterium]
MPRARWISRAFLTGIVVSALGACGGPDADGGDADRGTAGPFRGVRVSAAASLTDAFREVESAFEEAHPQVDVMLNLGGTSALRVQILEGAPVDVFASASTAQMERVVTAGEAAGDPVVFARNRLQIAVPEGNPAGVEGLEDFGDPDLVIGLCAESVPCGELARRTLRRAGVTPAVDTHEPDVRALLTKIELGELDAGIVYATDVAAAEGAVEGIPIPPEVNVRAEYPIAVLARSPNPDLASAFVDFVLSDAGQTILADHGFGGP